VPCEVVNNLEEIQHFEHVAKLFPTDPKLKRWKAHSYVGVPIMSPTTGKVLGIMVMIDRKSFNLTNDTEYLLTILSLRAGAELERQKSFELLRQQDEQLEKITQNSPDIIFECKQFSNGHVEYTYVSQAVEEILEISTENALRKASLLAKQIHPDDRKDFEKLHRLGWEKNDIQWIGRVISGKTKQEKWLKLVAKSDGIKKDYKVWHGVIDEITVEKKQEVALREAKLKAEEAALAKENFLANMSHEIRTPLNAIYGITELLLEEDAVKDLKYLSSLKFSVENLRALINNILDFSRLSAGNGSLKPRPMDLHLLIHNLIKTHSYIADKKEINLKLDKEERVPTWIMADELVLYQILNNLLSNALKFTEKGEVTLSVTNLQVEARRCLLRFEIQDTGIGIEKEELHRIFYKFEQGDTKYAREGSGLGLTISRLLLELWDSELKVESIPGDGSTFHFDLWVEKRAPQKQKAPKELAPVDTAVQKILLVEDVPENRMLLRKRFSKDKFFEMDEAEDGFQAIEKVKKKQYDLILMDMRMPGINGYETMLRIREMDAHHKQIPILALTADTYGVNKEQGWADVITKPFKFDEVIDTIRKHLNK
jgi:CheY-like chemotaxis protein